MKRKYFVWAAYALVALGLIAGSYFAGIALTGTSRADARSVDTQNSPPLIAPGDTTASPFLCNVNNVAVFDSRIHVRCNPADGSIAYFAYATSSPNANRYLALANTAYALGDRLYVYYYSDTAHNPPGCQTGDCRGFWGLSMVP